MIALILRRDARFACAIATLYGLDSAAAQCLLTQALEYQRDAAEMDPAVLS